MKLKFLLTLGFTLIAGFASPHANASPQRCNVTGIGARCNLGNRVFGGTGYDFTYSPSFSSGVPVLLWPTAVLMGESPVQYRSGKSGDACELAANEVTNDLIGMCQAAFPTADCEVSRTLPPERSGDDCKVTVFVTAYKQGSQPVAPPAPRDATTESNQNVPVIHQEHSR